MDVVLQHPSAADRNAIALKAYGRIVQHWGLTLAEAAALADMSDSTWKRARKPGYVADLTHDQMLRLSAVIGIYKALALYFGDEIAARWITLPNQGPLFSGARPVDTMIQDGLPQFLQVRLYLDALRGGA
ncbi:MbcA/ParS/Xre antitoxin family protein [Niveispirillum irakense]|uniref:MbcA/ParS/Xre antitoxin family protein n=1 Tax=Niveispirillum irakense TaxID=34011 RepID=UPI0004190867|nr:MbcA/ParS/Xre antitoxin family protein [Niveispirillum irakense]